MTKAQLQRRLWDLLLQGPTDYGVVAKKLGITQRVARDMVYQMRKRGLRIDSYFMVQARGEYRPAGKTHPNSVQALMRVHGREPLEVPE